LNEKNVDNKEFSATSLAKELNMTLQSIIQILLDMGLIKRNGKVWELTPTGLSRGGKYRDSAQTGRYIVWPNLSSQNLMIVMNLQANLLLLLP
jgi:hypothetical protein